LTADLAHETEAGSDSDGNITQPAVGTLPVSTSFGIELRISTEDLRREILRLRRASEA
jgi:hypothetical protein